MADPISLVQEVRASPPNPSMVDDRLVKPRPVRAAPLNPPTVVNRGSFYRAPVAAILQGGGMNGLGEAPIVLAQPAPGASLTPPSSPSLLNRRPVRVAPLSPPREVSRGTFQRAPVAAVLQGGGMNGIAGLAAAPSVSGGGLESVNVDKSVSAQQRAKKAIEGNTAPIAGDYTDAIRNAAGFAFGPKRMPGQGFAAASYSYPSKQMIVGATLAGVPIVAPPARPPMPNMSAPNLVTKGGIRGQISSSPSEDRRKMLSTLMGLGAIDYSGIDYTKISTGTFGFGADKEDDVTCTNEGTCREVKVIRVRKALAAAGKPVTDDAINFYGATKYNSIATLTGLINATWSSFLQNRKLDDVHYAGAFAQWVNNLVTSKQADAERIAAEKARQLASGGSGGGAPATGGGGSGVQLYIRPPTGQVMPGTGGQQAYSYTPPPQPAKKMNTALIVGGAVAGVALLGGIAYFAMKK